MLEDDSETEIGDYFRRNLLVVRKSVNAQDFKKFANLKSDGERVAFVLSIPESRMLPLAFPEVGKKNLERTLKHKENGNTIFGRGNFPKALELYSSAILMAPKTELGVLLANRSAVLYHLQMHELALSDAEEAVRIGYPEELLYKLQERKARCLLALKRHASAIDAFRNALKALDHAKISAERKQKVESDIRMMLAVMDKGSQLNGGVLSKDSAISRSGKSLPKLAGSRNPLYPAFSDAVEIRDAGDTLGRHAVAARNIFPGEVLAVEETHAAVLMAEYRLSHCDHCFARTVAPLPAACNSCSCVAYCSPKCRDLGAKLHAIECTLLPALWLSCASVTCLVALRAVSQKSLEELVELKKELQPGVKFVVSELKPYRANNYKALYGLVTHEDERTAEDLFHRAYMAGWLLRLLKRSSFFPEEINTPDEAESPLSEDEIYVGGLLLHNLQLLQFNAHEVSELSRLRRETTLEKAKSLFIGGGVYPSVALLNHSCNPAIIRYFIGTTMVVRALRTIRAGEEISENYGPIFTTTPENERKRRLRLQYWFDCSCEACTGHWPLLEEIDPRILRFRCDSGAACGYILPVKTDSNEFMVTCPKCKKNTNILKGLKAIEDTDAMFRVTSRYLEDGQHDKAFKGYLDILKLLDEHLAPPLRDYHLCQQGVRLCILTFGNTGFV